MTVKDAYTDLYLQKVRVNDRLYTDACARYGAPGTSAQWFVDNGCLLTNGDRSQLNVLHSYLTSVMQALFLIGHDYGWEREA